MFFLDFKLDYNSMFSTEVWLIQLFIDAGTQAQSSGVLFATIHSIHHGNKVMSVAVVFDSHALSAIPLNKKFVDT